MQLSVSFSTYPIPADSIYAPEEKKIDLNYNFHAREELFSGSGSIVGGGNLMLSLDEARDLMSQLADSISNVESRAMKSYS